MRRVLILAVLVVPLALALSPAVAGAADQQRWIVQLDPSASLPDLVGAVRGRFGVVPGQRFGNVMRGFAATMTRAQRDALAADPRVRAVVPDLPISAAADPYPETDAEVQPGIERVGALENAHRPGTALDVDIAVLDTGIQPDNPDLNVVGGYNCTDPANPNGGWGDAAFFGHGTHVAGIAAARQDGRGVTGVAQGARLWAIKVLHNNGNGYWSWVICGLDRIAAMTDGDGVTPTIEVANMSLAAPGADDGDCGNSSNDLLHQAVCRVADAGITMVVAAGNERSDAAGYVPGAYDEVITVSALADWNGAADGVAAPPAPGSPPTDCPRDYADDAFAEFSNFGADVDLVAPGTCVLSTLPINRLGLMTGTSMATPHVAGGAALYYLAEERAGRPRPTPQQVRAALVARGTLDWKTATDPDRGRPGSAREPALEVSDFDLAPFFDIGVRSQIVRTSAGSRASNGTWIARVGGFAGAVQMGVDPASLPPGARASFDGRTLNIDVPANTAPGSWSVRVTAASGSRADEATFRLIVYATVSDAGAPVMSLRSGVAAGVTSVPVRISWPAVPRAQRYQLQHSVDGSAWTTLARPYGTAYNVSATPGRRYQYRVRARIDATWHEWKTGAAAVARGMDPGSDVDLAGAWSPAMVDDTFGEAPVQSSAAGARATLAFEGRSVAWIGSRGPGRGRATVSIDGSVVATIDLYADRKRNRVILFATSWATAGAHTITVTVNGQPAGRPRVDLDAFVIVAD